MLLVVDERIPDRPSRAAADGIVHAQSDFWQRRSHDPSETRLQIRSSGREDDNSYPNSPDLECTATGALDFLSDEPNFPIHVPMENPRRL